MSGYQNQSKSLDAHMKRAQQYPILSKEEEIDLAKRYRDTGRRRYRDALIHHNLRFAVSQAHRHLRYMPNALEDLVQEANMGLVHAAEKFDPERGYRFITYAVWWVHAKIMIFVTRNTSIVKMGGTPDERRLFSMVHATFGRLQAANPYLDRDEVLNLVADELDAEVDRVSRIYDKLAAKDLSIDSDVGSQDAMNAGSTGTTYKDRLRDAGPLADELLEASQRSLTLHQLLGRAPLDERDRLIIRRRLMNADPATLAELGKHLGISRERVRQIERSIINKLARAAVDQRRELVGT